MPSGQNRRGGRKPATDLQDRVLAALCKCPAKAHELSSSLREPTKAITAILHRLKARGVVYATEPNEHDHVLIWAARNAAPGCLLNEHWPMPVEFPPLPVPGTVSEHKGAL